LTVLDEIGVFERKEEVGGDVSVGRNGEEEVRTREGG